MKKNTDSLVVYWAPWWDKNLNLDLDIMYHKPIPVYQDLLKSFNPPTITKNFMNCPAVKDHLESTFLVLNPSDTDMQVSFNEQNEVDGLINNNTVNTPVPGALKHSPTLTSQLLIEYGMSFSFFCEEPLELFISSPYFHQAPYLNYGAIVPGGFDIGKWYRPFNCEINLWEGNGRLVIKKDEPLAYFKFATDRKIILKGYNVNEKLYRLSVALVNFKDTSRWTSLLHRYERFSRSEMREIVLKEIKSNLIEGL